MCVCVKLNKRSVYLCILLWIYVHCGDYNRRSMSVTVTELRWPIIWADPTSGRPSRRLLVCHHKYTSRLPPYCAVFKYIPLIVCLHIRLSYRSVVSIEQSSALYVINSMWISLLYYSKLYLESSKALYLCLEIITNLQIITLFRFHSLFNK